MAKKKVSEVKKELAEISYWKWQFLRRSKDYIKSCEEWSKQPRDQWKENEIVLGYPYKGGLPQFFREPILNTRERCFITKELFPYYDQYSVEWANLRIGEEDQEMLFSMGFSPPQTRNQYSWKKHFKKYGLTLPIHPDLQDLPFFARFDPESKYITMPLKVDNNDLVLERGHISAIDVDWSQHKTHLLAVFDSLIDNQQQLLRLCNKKLQREIKPRIQIIKYPLYLKAWDARNKDMKWNEIYDVVFEGKVKYLSTIRKYVESAKKLIQGGYKNIG